VGYLEDYVGAVEKANKANGKEYEKVLKVRRKHTPNGQDSILISIDNPKPIEGRPPL
jgi:hypothetical protein